MKAYFSKLFSYDQQENLLMVDTILSVGIHTGKPYQIMSHMLAAQQIWLGRCKVQSSSVPTLWPEWGAEELKAHIQQNHSDYLTFLDTLAENDFQKNISYKNTRGDSFTNVLEDILAHVVNHGTHHRAQVGMLLKQGGLDSLPETDYIMYIRAR
jgi:uncharacterized damage-inducible protein DinB